MVRNNKPEFIRKIEEREGVFSLLDFHNYDKNLFKYLDEKKLTRVFEKGVVSNKGNAKWEEVIFKTNQNFYFHVSLYILNGEEEFGLTIYYKPEQFKELIFLTTQLLKPFKDGIPDIGTKKDVESELPNH